MLAICFGRRRGARWETDTVKYDALEGIYMGSGRWIYIRKNMAAKEVINVLTAVCILF